MLWRPSGTLGGLPLRASSLLTRRRVLGTGLAAAGCCLYQTRAGHFLRAAFGIAVQHPYWRMGAYRLLGRRPLHPRGGARHQLGVAGPSFGRGASDECRRARCAGHAAPPPRNQRAVSGGLAAIDRRRQITCMYLRGAGVASNSYHIHGMAIDLRAEGPGSVAGPQRGAEPALRRGRLLSALRLSSTSIAGRCAPGKGFG